MNAGKFNRLVTIQRPDTTAVDELGTPIPNVWVDVAKVWANIRYLSGAETIKSDADMSVVKVAIRLRGYRTDITAGMRINDTVLYDILAVMPDEVKHEFVDLACQTGASNG